MDRDLDRTLTGPGTRLRALRRQHDVTLADLAAATAISVSAVAAGVR